MQDLTTAEESYKDMCDTVNKAERFFPVPSAAMARVEAEQRVEAGKGTTHKSFSFLLHA